MSRFVQNKGVKEVLEAGRHLVQQTNRKLTLNMAGAGPMEEEIFDFIEKNSLESKFKYHGYVRGSDKVELLRKTFIFLFPSYHEGMPNAVLEAMSFGIPVVTTNVGGLSDFFVDREHGIMVQRRNTNQLREAIQTLIDRPSLYQEISKNNYKLAQDKFLSDKVAKRLKTLYRRELNGIG